ncbi:hypothetical protein [Vulcanisaeta sp. JCM 14467]|uniref:hypothetical protein n=1 Tax=Vulcanisaeta sp. JCM 14467 TaxID=1295370 RepID=UPI0006D12183|nr:hypothetical protein [Vulcanisaeta sp. JCM 14467]
MSKALDGLGGFGIGLLRRNRFCMGVKRSKYLLVRIPMYIIKNTKMLRGMSLRCCVGSIKSEG